MRMATKTRRWTRSDLETLPDDGNRYEVLDGSLFVTPQAAFFHQYIATRLTLALATYCDRHGLGAAVGPGAVVFDENELQPDVIVVPRLPAHRKEKWESLPRPRLVAEVLSDSTERRDHNVKREAYLRLGIPEYWIVDPDERRVLVWTPGSTEPTVVTDQLRWQPRADLPALEIPLESIIPPPPAEPPATPAS